MYKNILILLGVFLSHVGLYYYARHIDTPLPSTIEFGIVNLAEIRNSASLYKKFQDIVDTEYKIAQQKAAEIETKLRQLDTKIKAMRSSGQNVAVIKTQEELFKKEQAKAEAFMVQIKDDLNAYFQKLQDQMEDYVTKAVNTIVSQHKISVIFNAEGANARLVLYAKKNLDVTDSVLKVLNHITKDFVFERKS